MSQTPVSDRRTRQYDALSRIGSALTQCAVLTAMFVFSPLLPI